MDLHAAASPWVLRWAECLRLLLPVQARVLDVACGRGRHTRLFEDVGYKVTAVDRDAA